MEKKNKQCQSCGMPLNRKKAGDSRGTEKDGSFSEVYCSYCYENGQFTMPNITIEEMIVWGKQGIKDTDEMNKVMKFILLKMYNKSYLKKLSRWKEGN